MKFLLLEAEGEEVATSEVSSSGPSNIPLKSYSDKEIKNLSEADLKRLLDSREGDVSERRKYAKAYINKLFGDSSNIKDANSAVETSIIEKGIQNNPLLKFLQLFDSKNIGKLSGDAAILIGDILNRKNLSPGDNILYDKSLYNESEGNNTYKLKALSFLSDSDNVKKYGLFKVDEDGKPTKEPLSVEDLRGKNAEQVRQMLNKSQTKNFSNEGGKELTVRDYFKENGLNTSSYRELSDLLKKVYRNSKTLSSRRGYLTNILKNDRWSRHLMNQRVESLSDEDVASGLKSFLDSYAKMMQKSDRMNKKAVNKTSTNNQAGDAAKQAVFDEVVDSLKAYGLTKDELQKPFDQLYEPGKSAENLVFDVLKSMGK